MNRAKKPNLVELLEGIRAESAGNVPSDLLNFVVKTFVNHQFSDDRAEVRKIVHREVEVHVKRLAKKDRE